MDPRLHGDDRCRASSNPSRKQASVHTILPDSLAFIEGPMTPVAARKPATRLNELTATEMASAIAAGSTTSEAVVRACIERIEAREPQVLAWQYFNAEQAIAQARAFDKSGRRGAL